MKRTLACLTVALACAALPASAAAHAILTLDGGLLLFNSPDSISLDQVVIAQPSPDVVQLEDRTVSGGIDPGPCTPFSEYVVNCPSSSVASLTLDLGPRDDRSEVRVARPVTVYGGPGQDQLSGGPLADIIDGGDGSDRLAGGAGGDTLIGRSGEDTFDGGPGDDDVRSRDGVPDTVSCGEGGDRVSADPTDVVAFDCEAVDRALPGSTPLPEDVPPTASVSGRRIQRVARSKRVRVGGSSTKAGKLTAYTTVSIKSLRYRLQAVTRPVTEGGRVTLVPRIDRSVMRRVEAAWRERQRVTALVRVQAVDGFGNRSGARQLRVRLTR